MKPVLIIIAVVVALILGWFFVSPLFIDQTVDEPFNLEDGSFNMDAVMAMSEAERMSAREVIMSSAASAPDKAMSDDMPNETRVLSRGTFVDADAIHKGSGDALVYATADGRQLVRFENFKTTNGPALVVYLAKHPNPTTAADVTDGGFVNLGKLKGNVGNQNYWLSDDVDVAEYGSVVIWCELFGVLFSPASLQGA